MIYPTVPFPVTLGDLNPRFQGHGVIRPTDATDMCAQMKRDLFSIAKFLLNKIIESEISYYPPYEGY